MTLLGANPPRVLHVTEASLGGLRRHIADLMIGLHKLGVEQGLAYAPWRADSGMLALVEWCRSVGIPVHEIEMVRSVSPLTDLKSMRLLRNVIHEFRPTVLHLHSSKAGGVGRLAALGSRRIATVYTPNGLATHLSKGFKIAESILGHVRTDRLIAVSQSEYDEIAAMQIVPRARLVRVDSGISSEDVRELAARTSDAALSSVVFVGRLSFQKDPLFAAEVSALVLQAVPTARFTWVGDGELRAEFEARLNKFGVRSRWTITGWMDNPYPIVAASQICALASRYESFGYVTLEAMALAKPVVATKVAGSADLVAHEQTGLLIPLDAPNEFANALIRLLLSEDDRRRMGTAAATRAALFSRERMARETVDVYNDASSATTRS